MKLNELFSNLSFGPLANLSVGGDGIGMIPFEHEARLTSFVNKSLLALFSRFPLLEKEVIVRAYDGKTLYPLKKIYADTDATVVPQKFIADSAVDPFLEDVIKILAIYDELGQPMPLNNTGEPTSLFTPLFDMVQIPLPKTGDIYYVLYRGKHPVLVPGVADQDVNIPDILQTALEAHVAYQVFSPMNGQEHKATASEHLSTYEMLCSNIEMQDLLQTSSVSNHDKLEARGFV